jgi:protein-S-isoprenylcysteine O-methyltransferase Ste14
MNPWIGNSIFLASVIASIAIRVPHDRVSQETKVAESRRGPLENLLLLLVILGMVVLPVLSFTPALSFAAYPPDILRIALGTIAMVASLGIFYRSHRDLGRNWSASLELREGHVLVTNGIYRSIRHPMYTSIFLLAIGQALLLANWIAGPALLVTFTLMFLSRLHSEERMMLDKFGAQYEEYRRRSKRLIPGIW